MLEAEKRNLNELPATLSVDQAASIMGVSRNTMYDVVKERNLAIRVGEKRLRVVRDRLIDYLETA